MKTTETFHAAVLATMTRNQWPYAYALGYVSGNDDRLAGRAREHKPEGDDYTLGYHRAYDWND